MNLLSRNLFINMKNDTIFFFIFRYPFHIITTLRWPSSQAAVFFLRTED